MFEFFVTSWVSCSRGIVVLLFQVEPQRVVEGDVAFFTVVYYTVVVGAFSYQDRFALADSVF